ncbi:predicted protein [Nematostella vectensis]|uniref:Transmembrane protein 208 n=1 Tax=Nematostella vectensis TaxID=45351 RepID=A7S3V9_NEMVE|nr:predicted protein [Nematostella vectensis]|eukprot:XP_001633618.1 predicted protein [Nematostella vectensis]
MHTPVVSKGPNVFIALKNWGLCILLPYLNYLFCFHVTHLVFRFSFFAFSVSWLTWLVFILTSLLYLGCYKFMHYLAREGMDLNADSGTSEHIKDLILLTVIVQGLAIFTDYFWFFWLLAPLRAVYILWVNILGPWIFAEPPESDMDPKKQRKMERKMKRAGMM